MPPTQPLPKLRKPASTQPEYIFPQVDMQTLIQPEKEYWILLRSAADAFHTCKRLFTKHQTPGELRKKWRLFSSYIHQAEGYWDAAMKTSPRSAGLLFYYSFLDLVKAFLLLKHHSLGGSNEIHGLSGRANVWKGGLGNKRLRIVPGRANQVAVFPSYYKEVFGCSPPGSLSVRKLLSYVPGIGSQYQAVERQNGSYVPFIHRWVCDQRRQKAWTIWGVLKGFPLEKYRRCFKNCFTEFERIETPPPGSDLRSLLREIFEFKGIGWAHFDYFQTKAGREVAMLAEKWPMQELRHRLRACMGNTLLPQYHDKGSSAFLYLPLDKRTGLPMDGDIATFAIMYFISELVRYHTDYLQRLFTTPRGWLLESFVEISPHYFLRAITSRIQGEVVHISLH